MTPTQQLTAGRIAAGVRVVGWVVSILQGRDRWMLGIHRTFIEAR